MADPLSCYDYLKGVFLAKVLSTTTDFTYSNLYPQVNGQEPTVSDLPLTDFYTNINALADEFALAMGANP